MKTVSSCCIHSLLRWNRFFQHGWFFITFKPKSIFTLFLEGNYKEKLNVYCFFLSLHHFVVIYQKPNQIICGVLPSAEHHTVWQCTTIQPPPPKGCPSASNRPTSKLWQIECIKEKTLLVPFWTKWYKESAVFSHRKKKKCSEDWVISNYSKSQHR